MPPEVPIQGDIFRPLEGRSFRFRCHPGLSCFKQCCARLRLILTPYDIIRMKNRLGIASDRFLELHTETIIDEQSRFPLVRLRMGAEKAATCPFLGERGCTIYEDRPAACRLYPLGRAATMVGGEQAARERFFVVSEGHCKGFAEEKEWTIEEWMRHEGLDVYNRINDPWLEIITSAKPFANPAETLRKFQMFSMVSYNPDRFRAFLFGSSFFDLFDVKKETREALSEDDVALLRFGYDWLKLSLFGDEGGWVRKTGSSAPSRPIAPASGASPFSPS